jgi:hypothetical protein
LLRGVRPSRERPFAHVRSRRRRPSEAATCVYGLLICGQCGCAITAERKKGKYVYYHCTNFHGGCENTYIREVRLAELLGNAVSAIEIPEGVAADLAAAMRACDDDARRQSVDGRRQLDDRHRATAAKLDRAYEDYLDGRISDALWTRKSEAWEAELRDIESQRARVTAPRTPIAVTAEKILDCTQYCRTRRSIAEVFLSFTLPHSTCWRGATNR